MVEHPGLDGFHGIEVDQPLRVSGDNVRSENHRDLFECLESGEPGATRRVADKVTRLHGGRGQVRRLGKRDRGLLKAGGYKCCRSIEGLDLHDLGLGVHLGREIVAALAEGSGEGLLAGVGRDGDRELGFVALSLCRGNLH